MLEMMWLSYIGRQPRAIFLFTLFDLKDIDFRNKRRISWL